MIMTSKNDLDLLREFTRDESQDAFSELVQRHLNLVYCAALRQVRSPQLAEEVAQSVFCDLARNAFLLKPDTVLTAWLYQVTRRTAINVVRGEARRQLREQIALEMNEMNATADDWTQIEPLLDDAMSALGAIDRTAILLRYFENKSLREVGQALGTTDDTARKRVNHAIDCLRDYFNTRGVTVGAGGLVVVLSANAVQAAPVGLAASISAGVVLVGATTAVTATTAKVFAMTTLQKVLITTAAAAAVGTGILEVRQNSRLRDQVQTLEQRQAPSAEQFQGLQKERDDARRRIAALTDEVASLKANSAELLRLRGEVTQLKAAPPHSMEMASQALVANANLAKQRLDQMPDKKIPELQFLSDYDWLIVVKDYKFENDEDYRKAFNGLRCTAKNEFGNLLRKALQGYATANDGQLPGDVGK